MAGYSGSRLEYLTRGGVKTRISRQRNPKLKTPPLRVLDTAFQNMCAKFRGLPRKNGVRNSRGHNFGRSTWTSLYVLSWRIYQVGRWLPSMLPGSNRTILHNHSVHWYCITLIRVGIILSTIFMEDMVNRTRVEGGGYSKHDIITWFD